MAKSRLARFASDLSRCIFCLSVTLKSACFTPYRGITESWQIATRPEDFDVLFAGKEVNFMTRKQIAISIYLPVFADLRRRYRACLKSYVNALFNLGYATIELAMPFESVERKREKSSKENFRLNFVFGVTNRSFP